MNLINSIESCNDSVSELTRISQQIKPLIESTVNTIYKSNAHDLVSKPDDYIIPAVWGAVQIGSLDSTQTRISNLIQPLIDQISEKVAGRHVSVEQSFAIKYLIREMLIYKILFLNNQVKILLKEQDTPADSDSAETDEFITIGNA